MGLCQVDLDLFKRIIDDMLSLRNNMPEMKAKLVKNKGDVYADDWAVSFDQVTGWVDESLRMLRQRLTQIYTILQMNPSLSVLEIDEEIPDDTPEWMTPEQALDEGSRWGQSALDLGYCEDFSDEQWLELQLLMNDPAFAAGFYKATGLEWMAQMESVLQTSSLAGTPAGVLRLSVLQGLLGSAASFSQAWSDIVVGDISGAFGLPGGQTISIDSLTDLLAGARFPGACAARIADSLFNLTGLPEALDSQPIGFDLTALDTIWGGVFSMLANSPDGATLFFGNMDPSTEITVGYGGQGCPLNEDVSVSSRIEWLLTHNWPPDVAEAAGAALVAAGSPQGDQPMTFMQAQVVTQTLTFMAWMSNQSSVTWSPVPGVGLAVGVLLANNMFELFANAPQSYVDGDRNYFEVWPQSNYPPDREPAFDTSRFGIPWIDGDGNNRLGVDGSVLGLVLQSLASVPGATDIVVTSWGVYTPAWLAARIPPASGAGDAVYGSPSQSALDMGFAANVLSFIIQNAMAGLPNPDAKNTTCSELSALASLAFDIGMGFMIENPYVAGGVAVVVAGVSWLTSQWREAVKQAQRQALSDRLNSGTSAVDAAYVDYLRLLAKLGYFDPNIVSAAGHLPPPTGIVDDDGNYNPDAPGVSNWISTSGLDAASDKIDRSGLGDQTRNEKAVKVP